MFSDNKNLIDKKEIRQLEALVTTNLYTDFVSGTKMTYYEIDIRIHIKTEEPSKYENIEIYTNYGTVKGHIVYYYSEGKVSRIIAHVRKTKDADIITKCRTENAKHSAFPHRFNNSMAYLDEMSHNLMITL